MIALLGLALLASAADTVCTRSAPTERGIEIYARVRPGKPDSLSVITLCAVGGKAASRVGSYHGKLLFDSTVVRVVRTESATGAVRLENAKVPGEIEFAGASRDGFSFGPMLRAVVRTRRDQPWNLRVSIAEANDSTRKSLLASVIVGRPDATSPLIGPSDVPDTQPCTRAVTSDAPRLIRLDPDSIAFSRIESGETITVQIHGCGFDPSNNRVRIGADTLNDVRSANDGQLILIGFPPPLRSGEVPRRLQAGSYTISVLRNNRSSNALTLIVR